MLSRKTFGTAILSNTNIVSNSIAVYADAIQIKLDSVAKAWGYDDVKTAVTYADEPSVPQFQNDGKALRAWRSLVWQTAYSILATADPNNPPTIEYVLTQLPQAPTKP